MMKRRLKKMELKLNIEFDEEKMKEIVEQAVANLKAEGWLYRDSLKVLPDTPSTYIHPDPSQYKIYDPTLIPRGK